MKKIYIYETPTSKENGFIKIGETTRDNVEDRIKEQFSSAALYDEEDCLYTILHERVATKENGLSYSDKDFHKFLLEKGVLKPRKDKEWFLLTLEQAIAALEAFEKGEEHTHSIHRINNFPMRKEQQMAVEQAFDFFSKNKGIYETNDFLWNAKMRFGKTFSAYQLMKISNWNKVLVITYRPAVKKSWRDDLNTHKDFDNYVFLSNDNIKNINTNHKNVVFMSFQELLKSKDNLNPKHKVVFTVEWDCIIIDEFHYGTSTENAKAMFTGYNDEEEETLKDSLDQDALKEIEEELREEFDIIENTLPKLKTKNRLFLSGTPFKAITSNRFAKNQIFNWTYLDEQIEKQLWFKNNPHIDIEKNPYYSLPQLNLFIYEISNQNFQKGLDKNKNEFSLSYFFKSKNNKFENEESVKKWLDIISGQTYLSSNDEEFEENINIIKEKSKFPFANSDTGGLSDILKHTFWLLPSVSSCKAMQKLLSNHNVFSNYHVLVAAGTEFGIGASAIPPVEQAISTKDKTITLSCGKLTEGVTIKEWTAVLFLTDIKSPERYFQTAFRAQSPWIKESKVMKKHCYIFDFHPSRSLKLLSEYSDKLIKDPNKGLISLCEKKDNLSNFIKYLPILKISGNYMTELNANNVMSYDYSTYNSTDLIKAFQSHRNVNISKSLIAELLSNVDVLNKCDDILNNIKAYRKFIGNNKDVSTIKNLGDETKILENLKTRELKEKDKITQKNINKEITNKEKKLKEKQDEIRELLKILLGRIPLFMYLTHALEEDLLEVLNNTQSEKMGLFRKSTGIEVEDFEFLMEAGLIKSESINSYIQRFKEIELLNYKSDNTLFSGL